MITLLSEPGKLAGVELRVEGDAYRHLFRARRLAVGERRRVVDGRGRAGWGDVARVERAAAVVALGEPAPANEPELRVELLAATLRPERASWLVEKATELGVFAVRFVHSARAPRTFGAGTLERLRRVAAAAVEQCHRSRLPDVTGTHAWEEVAALTAGIADRRLLDTAAEGSAPPKPGGAVAFLVGPEGGWSPEERAD